MSKESFIYYFYICIPLFKKYILLIFYREKGREIETRNEDERETSTSCLLHTPHRGCAHNQGYMPLTGIEPGTLQSSGRSSIYWAKPVRVWHSFLKATQQSKRKSALPTKAKGVSELVGSFLLKKMFTLLLHHLRCSINIIDHLIPDKC